MPTRILSALSLAALLLTLAGCHTTQFGKSIGYPSPQQGAQDGDQSLQ